MPDDLKRVLVKLKKQLCAGSYPERLKAATTILKLHGKRNP